MSNRHHGGPTPSGCHRLKFSNLSPQSGFRFHITQISTRDHNSGSAERRAMGIMAKQAEYQERKKLQIINTLKDRLGESHPMPASWQLAKILNRFKDSESMAKAWAAAHNPKTPKVLLKGMLQQPKSKAPEEQDTGCRSPGKTPGQTLQGSSLGDLTVRDLPRHLKLDVVNSILGNLGGVARIVYESEDIVQVEKLNEILGILQAISENTDWVNSTRRSILRKARELKEAESQP